MTMTVDQVASNPFVHNAAFQPTKPSGRSMFGKQADSKKATSPMYSFIKTTDRNQASKMFLSQAHINVDHRCLESPGAIYALPSAVDKQVETSKQSAPSYSFAHTDRMKALTTAVPGPGTYDKPGALGPQNESLKRTGPRHAFSSTERGQAQKVFVSNQHLRQQLGTAGSPPGSYSSPSALGSQHLSQRHSMPAFSMPRTDRLRDKFKKAAVSLPPVGHYETWHAIGKQPLSKFKTLPAYGFGGSSWGKEERRFLTLGHTKEWQGLASPNNFNHQHPENTTSFGHQLLSNRQSPASTKFGLEQKLIFKTPNTPGPGAYD